MEKTNICQNCSQEIPDGVKFCPHCGASQAPKSERVCQNCGTVNKQSNAFCVNCGYSLNNSNSAPAEKQPQEGTPAQPLPKPEKVSRLKGDFPIKKILSISKCSLLVLFALLIMIFSFVPSIKMDAEDIFTELGISSAKLDDVKDFKISPFQMITLMFDSTKNYDLDKIQDSKVYDKYMDVADEVKNFDKDDLLSKKGVKVLYKLAFLNVRMAVMSESDYSQTTNADKLDFVYAGIAAFLQLIASSALLVFAVLSLVYLILGKSKFARITNVLFSVVFGITFTYILALNQVIDSKMKIAGTLITAAVLSACGIALMMADSFIEKKTSTKRLIKGGACVMIVLLMFIGLLLPVMTTKAKVSLRNESSEKSVSFNVKPTFYSDLTMTKDQQDELKDITDGLEKSEKKDYLKRVLNSYRGYTKKQVSDGLADDIHEKVLFYFLTIYGIGAEGYLQFTYIYYMLLALILTAFLALNADATVYGSNSKIKGLLLIFALIFTIAILVSGIITVACVSISISRYSLSSLYSITLSAGSIMPVVVAIILLVFNGIFKAKKKDEENPS